MGLQAGPDFDTTHGRAWRPVLQKYNHATSQDDNNSPQFPPHHKLRIRVACAERNASTGVQRFARENE
jgi:hypothetical protein